ncbi:MAG: 5-methyltetrahydropteroyltriglutamate--homocysteine S-methyltransferase [Actinomycetota bacterium]
MFRSHIAGFPRIGAKRELKHATEGYWRGETPVSQLDATARQIRRENWELMRDFGIDFIPSNDFSYYDHVLDTICLLGAVPPRYGHRKGAVPLDTYFSMARGAQKDGIDVTAMEMTKWFNTNYHYIVPELDGSTKFSIRGEKPWDHYREAKAFGIETTPVILGPLSFLLLAKPSPEASEDFSTLSLLDRLLPLYEKLCEKAEWNGAEWIQFDEPVLIGDRTAEELAALTGIYRRLSQTAQRPNILVNTYFDHVGEAYPVLRDLPVEGIGLDFVHGALNEQLIAEHGWGKRSWKKTLFAGVVNGRNIWITDLQQRLEQLRRLADAADRLVVSTSCSLLHVPIDLDNEPDLDPEIRPWLAFARQRVEEVCLLTKALNKGESSISQALEKNQAALESRRTSRKAINPDVRKRLEALSEADEHRANAYAGRRTVQHEALNLPPLPSTTIGSYPQTHEIREARARLRKGELTSDQYKEEIRREIERVIRFQEKAGLDVLVHGEPERNDMVQYFAEQMDGYAFTTNAWVQSYGSRYVRPPIIYGDLQRAAPMTVEWTKFAQSLTDKPVKGMLTGPVTMLMWSFVRDDQPPSDTCRQLALAIRDEIADLEGAGFSVIQVDEPALREGLPLRKDRWSEYLDWAVACFRLATAVVADRTQIQTHMCYADFGDIIDSIGAMDADVLLIEAARSQMELLEDFKRSGYEQEVGPGVYDIHSPRVPSIEEMADKLKAAARVLPPQQLWVTPDCGLKTRGWSETEPALANMVAAAARVREELSS